MAVYVDTSAWIALLATNDAHHRTAVKALRELVEQRIPLRTGNHTVIELIDGIAARKGQTVAARTADRIFDNRFVRVVPSEPLMPRALQILKERADWNVDLSDCLSFAIMQAMGIRCAFTYDSDFEKTGFERAG